MSIGKNGIHGGLSGKTGPVVGYYRLGKWVVRSLPIKTQKNKSGTEAQNIYRRKFKMAHQFLKPILHVIRMGYREVSMIHQATGYNLAMTHLLNEVFIENKAMDYAKVCISQGSLPPLSPVNLSFTEAEIELTWDPKHPLNSQGTTDQLLVLVYDPAQRKVLFQGTDVGRSKGKASIPITIQVNAPSNFHVWVACINDTRTKVSNSQYVGIVTIG
ncbi:MAG: hypothetical protein EOO99_04850 [Pedobacter sp.]|nr:MAG: hypothetical protein EOO99_04850 [Pedobacter sp.]